MRSERIGSLLLRGAALAGLTLACVTHSIIAGLFLLMEIVAGGLAHSGVRWWAPLLYTLALVLTGFALRRTWARWNSSRSDSGFRREWFADVIGPGSIAAASLLVGLRALTWLIQRDEASSWLVAGWRWRF